MEVDEPTRKQEFFGKLQDVQEKCCSFLVEHRGATIIRGSPYRSLGVTSLLTNYFKLSPAEEQRIKGSRDRGASADVMAFKGNVETSTLIDGYCTPIGTIKFKDSHDMIVQLDTLFLRNSIVSLYEGEFNIGLNTVVIPTTPGSTDMVHPTGAIDMLKYNERSRKLVAVELKTSKTSKNFTTLSNAFLKAKHVKQLQFYVWELKNMFDSAGISFDSRDFELLIVGVHETAMLIGMWRIAYMPKYFLGETWGGGRWHSIWAATRRLSSSEIPCKGCGAGSHFQDPGDTRVFWCSKECRQRVYALNSQGGSTIVLD